MNKELEALEEIKSFILDIQCGTFNSKAIRFTDSFVYLEQNVFPIIETALKELDFYKKRDKQWKQDVNKNINKLKALEIIKEKNVNIGLLKDEECTFEIYNTMMLLKECQLTEEEFDLLKEVLL